MIFYFIFFLSLDRYNNSLLLEGEDQYIFRTMASSSQTPPPKYDVFLSFRGEDTRYNFISHLYAELQRKKIQTFIDDRLCRGDEISPTLYRAIEESMIYVVVLSENYASSTWCLDELTHILQCKEKYSGRHVIPVFYKVDPSDVRHQRESYAEAFVKHQRRFKDDQVNAWKKALTQIAALSGWDSQVTRSLFYNLIITLSYHSLINIFICYFRCI